MLHLAYILNQAYFAVDSIAYDYVSLYPHTPATPPISDGEILQSVKHIYQNLFDAKANINMAYLEPRIRRLPLDKMLEMYDVDHYNLLEKGVIYNSVPLVKSLLAQHQQNGRRENMRRYNGPLLQLKGAAHLAAVLGAEDVVKVMLAKCPD